MKFQRYSAIITGLAISLFIIGINGVDVGLPNYITSNRLGILLLILVNIILLLNTKLIIKYNKNIVYLTIVTLFLAVWSFIAIISSPYYLETTLNSSITWILIALTLTLLGNILLNVNESFYKVFLNTIIFLGSLITLVYFSWTLVNVGNFSDNYAWRGIFRETSNGLNRVMNGLLIFNILNITIILGLIKKNIFLSIVSFLSLVTFFSFIFLTGTRQTLLGLIVAVIIATLLSFVLKLNRKKLKIFKLGISTIVIGFLTVVIVRYFELTDWIQNRFINTTIESSSGDLQRIQVFQEAVYYFKLYPLMGVGPGAFTVINSQQIYTHNGYVNMIVSIGIIPTLLTLTTIIISLLIGYKKLRVIQSVETYNLIIFSYIAFIVFTIVSNIFNDLLDEYIYWILMLFLMAIPIKTK